MMNGGNKRKQILKTNISYLHQALPRSNKKLNSEN